MNTSNLKCSIISREYPPHIYGGAGVHVQELVKALRAKGELEIDVHCFDGERSEPSVFGYKPSSEDLKGVFSTIDIDNQIANAISADTSLVHSHTWYANLAGFLSSKNLGIPHIITAHSLEPLRPWKAEQLGGGYAISSFIEKTAYEAADGIIAVSNAMRADILQAYPNVNPEKVHTILNGIDIEKFKTLDEQTYTPIIERLAEKYDIDISMPTAIFVGRITRQKGLVYLMKALEKVPNDIQIILCAGAPDTPEIAAEVEDLYNKLSQKRGSVCLISDMLPNLDLKACLQFSDLFLCPSIYEPLGIVNLEAMAMGLPVLATRTGGIPEVVLNQETGYLIDLEQKTDGTGEPLNPEKFVSDISSAIISAFSNPAQLRSFGALGRARVEKEFTWEKIASLTLDFYRNFV